MTLDDLLALLPDNTSGEISAADLRTIVTELWNYTASVQATLNGVVVNSVPALEARSAKAGQVASDGTLVYGPDGWTSERLEAGVYKVTHNLHVTEDYSVTITPLAHAIDGWAPGVDAIDEDSFTYGIYSTQHAGLHDVYTNFVVAVNP
jgi:hypothetical protein